MTTEATTTIQTGTTPNPVASNAQDFSGSDDEIFDNFAEGPQPGDPPPSGDTHDDGMPMGLGGEMGKQSEPASSTLESDILNGTTQPGGETSPEDTAGEPDPVPEPAGETGAETNPEPTSEEPETPEFPPALLQMAGLTDASSAQAAGFKDPEALFAAIKWRGQLLTPEAQPVQPSEQGLYGRPVQPTTAPAEPAATPEETSQVKPFQLPDEKMEMLDDDLQDVIRQMNDHYQQEITSLRSTTVQQESSNKAMEFDKAVQSLGDEWRDVFGEGDGTVLARAGQTDPVAMTNYNHRAMLFDAVEAVREVNAKQGYKPMALEQEVQWALMQRYPDKFQQTISGKSNGKPPRQRSAVASRPTQRNAPPKSQSKETVDAVDAMLRKRRGYSIDRNAPDELDGEI